MATINALGNIGNTNKQVEIALIRANDYDASRTVRKAAERAMERLQFTTSAAGGNRTGVHPSVANPQPAVTPVVGSDLAQLIELLHSPSPVTRKAGVADLGKLGSRAVSAKRVLIKLMIGDPDAGVREAARQAIKQVSQ